MVHPGVGRIVKYHPLYPIVSYCIFWVLCMNQQQQEADEEEQEEKEEEEEESSVAGGWLNVRGCQWTTSHTILALYYILYWYYTNGYGTLSECAVPVSETVCVRCNVSSGVLILGVCYTLLSLTVLYSVQYCVQYMLSVQCWVYNICWVLSVQYMLSVEKDKAEQPSATCDTRHSDATNLGCKKIKINN